MSYRDWPKRIKGNMFTLAQKDPDEYPELRVRTWTNLFGSGGSVSIDADGTDLASIHLDEDGSVAAEREHLQDLVDEWNEDPAGNWRSLIADSRTRVRAYYEKQVTEAQDKLSRIDEGVWS